MRVVMPLLFANCSLIAFATLGAEGTAWQPSSGHTQVAIWPKEPPGAQPVKGSETTQIDTKDLVASKPWISVENVSRPTITVYSPSGKNTGAAVVVFPGGGYEILAIDLEGTEICDWLTSRGITAVLLKYRVPTEKVGPYKESLLALQDAQRAVGLVRFHAAEWHIDPHKIGVIGFSAGGGMVAELSTHFDKRLYPTVDAADEVSCRPDFAIACYPGHLWDGGENLKLNPDIATNVTRRTPPTFLLQAEDDHVDGVQQSLVYYNGLMKAGVPVEIHLYAEGGHAFGLRRSKFPITAWPQLVETWLKTIGMISECYGLTNR
jgi:acetyl esterase/lipase